MRVEWPDLCNSHALGQTSMNVVWELSDGFLQLLCTWWNDHESCRRVEWSVLFNSHALGKTSMTVVWELSDQICSTLMHSVKQAWMLYESWVTSFFQLSCTWSNDHESCMRVEWPVLFNSHALGRMSMRVVWNWVTSFVQFLCTRSNENKSCMRVEWPVFFNSHAIDQTTMRVVRESSDQFCSTLIHTVKRAWQLYCTRVEWPVLFNSYAPGQYERAWQWYESWQESLNKCVNLSPVLIENLNMFEVESARALKSQWECEFELLWTFINSRGFLGFAPKCMHYEVYS